jgi:hypothetical protein
MLVVRVELWSAITGEHTEIARMVIDNLGTGTAASGDYRARTYRGRSIHQLERAMLNGDITREGRVEKHRRLALHVWHLVGKALASMGYGQTERQPRLPLGEVRR